MRGMLVSLALMTACGFEGAAGSSADGPMPPEPDGPSTPSCIPGFVSLCGQVEPTGSLMVAPGGDDPINTDLDMRCRLVEQPGGPTICLLYFTEIQIQTGASLLAYGARPLALVAKTALEIEGVLDVSSKRDRLALPGAGASPATPGLCTSTRSPADSNTAGGGGGGAGGTLGTVGGDGGTAANGMREGGLAGAALATPSLLRGGCDGQRGGAGSAAGALGGLGGGAVYLAASTIEISGSVLASGSGAGAAAFYDGGGGGGSGGMIVLQSDAIQVTGLLLATGGGGGQGGDNNGIGAAGADPVSPLPAAGGAAVGAGGVGGAGGTNLAGVTGSGNSNGAGGGGGGAGLILLLGAQPSTAGAMIMPPVIARSP